jgi:hypothetical protein
MPAFRDVLHARNIFTQRTSGLRYHVRSPSPPPRPSSPAPATVVPSRVVSPPAAVLRRCCPPPRESARGLLVIGARARRRWWRPRCVGERWWDRPGPVRLLLLLLLWSGAVESCVRWRRGDVRVETRLERCLRKKRWRRRRIRREGIRSTTCRLERPRVCRPR